MPALNTAVTNRKTIKKRGPYLTKYFREGGSQTFKVNDLVGVNTTNAHLLIAATGGNSYASDSTNPILGFAVQAGSNTTANTVNCAVDCFIEGSEFAVPVTNANANAVTAYSQLNGTLYTLYNDNSYSWLLAVNTSTNGVAEGIEIDPAEPVGTQNGYIWCRIPASKRYLS